MMRILIFWFLGLIALSAQSAIVVDAHTGRVLYESDSRRVRPIASLTKVATAIVVLDWVKYSGNDLNLLAPAPQAVVGLGGPNPMALKPGQSVSLRDGLTSALLGSDNAAAETLAYYVGMRMAKQRGSSKPPRAEFIAEMNTLAKALGMTKTKFANPHGMDTVLERGKSNAEDLVKLCQYALTKPELRNIVNTKKAKVSKYTGGSTQHFYSLNTNELIGQKGYHGIKTGMTGLAGPCLATYYVEGRTHLICIVLDSLDRFGLTRALVNQSLAQQRTGLSLDAGSGGVIRYTPPVNR